MRLRERLVMGLSALTVLVILSLVHLYLELGMSGCKHTPRNTPGGSDKVSPVTTRDQFKDLEAYLNMASDEDTAHGVILTTDQDRIKEINKMTLEKVLNMKKRTNETLMETFYRGITAHQLYAEDDPVVELLLRDMASRPIVYAEEIAAGTQFKLLIRYDNGQQAIFKPMRASREQTTPPDAFYFTDIERHTAEVAAFHLDRLLGFRRTLPVTGRTLNMTSEILAVTDDTLRARFYTSPANNLCFVGTKCGVFCDLTHPICGRSHLLEGSFSTFLPPDNITKRMVYMSPWRRSYDVFAKVQWERDPNYCKLIRQVAPYNSEERIYNFMDTTVLDFLLGNWDRHHYDTFQVFDGDPFILTLDNGRGSGRPFSDDLSILAPILQCCLIRDTTLQTLIRYHNGPIPLSEAMRRSLAKDPINPVLWEPHLVALDRRIGIILKTIRDCLEAAKDVE